MTGDPLNVNARLYNQIGKLLDDMEKADRDETMTFPQRINALIAVGRVQVMFAGLRKAEARESGSAGSTVRKYSAAFARADAARRRKVAARSSADDSTVIELVSTGRDPTDDDDA